MTVALKTTANGATPGVSTLWTAAHGLVSYPDAIAEMEAQVAEIADGRAPERVWLVEHPALYTAGTSAKPSDLLDPAALPVFPTGRGGQYTYHGPGQRIAYAMLDLRRRGSDLRRYVSDLEEWIIRTLAAFGITGERRCDRVGVWVVAADGSEAKIAAIGVRVRRWITFHGIALNVEPDLGNYAGIVPCGIAEHGVTSMRALGSGATMAEVDAALRREFAAVFDPAG